MRTKQNPEFATVDEYIAAQPEHTRATLNLLRQTIKNAAPKAMEKISWGMPGYRYEGMLCWFAAFKNHYGFYVMADSIKVFKEKLKPYELSKGTIRFPIGKPLPLDLITEMVKYRVDVNLEKAIFKEQIKSKKVKK